MQKKHKNRPEIKMTDFLMGRVRKRRNWEQGGGLMRDWSRFLCWTES